MKNAEHKAGPVDDQPVAIESKDYLGRWTFARSLFDLATSVPDESSVRIGVYGKWGTGKSSVLRMLAFQATQENIPVVIFEPWSARDSSSLWSDFVSQLRRALQGEKPPWLHNLNFRATVRAGAKVIGVAAPAIERLPELSGLTALLAKIAGSAAKTLADDVRTVTKPLKKANKRIIVLVDELDRTRPDLVPDVLLTLRQILDIPGFSFVLAFDAELIGSALGQANEAWGRNVQFLEKVVEYPRTLPAPSSRDLSRFTAHLRASYAPWISDAAFHGIRTLLPTNPRRLKLLFRLLWAVGLQRERFDDGEIDESVIILSALLRAYNPLLADNVIHHDDTWTWLTEARIRSITNKKDADSEFEKEIAQRMEFFGLTNDPDAARIRSSLQRLAWFAHHRESFVLAANLGDIPPAFSLREVLAVTGQSEADRNAVLGEIAERRSLSFNDVRWECIVAACGLWARECERAANAHAESETINHIENARVAVALIGTLCSEGLNVDSVLFGKMLDVARDWCHFDNLPEYRKLRAAEKTMLGSLIGRLDSEIPGIVSRLHSAQRLYRGDRDQRESLTQYLYSHAEKKFCLQLLEAFEEPLALENLCDIQWAQVTRPLLFEADSCFWQHHRLDFIQGCQTPTFKRSVSLTHFIERLCHESKSTRFCDRLKSEKLALDDELVNAVWAGALAIRVQPRQLGGFVAVEEWLRSVRSEPMLSPDWYVEAKTRRVANNILDNENSNEEGPN